MSSSPNDFHQPPARVGPAGREPTRVPLALEETALAVCMALLFLLTLANVLVRHFISISFAFTEEWSIVLMVIATLLGAGIAAATGRHIRIGFLADRGRPASRRGFALLGALATAAMFGVLVWWGGLAAWDDYRFEVTSPALDWPAWVYSAWLPLLALAVAARALGRALRLIRGRIP